MRDGGRANDLLRPTGLRLQHAKPEPMQHAKPKRCNTPKPQRALCNSLGRSPRTGQRSAKEKKAKPRRGALTECSTRLARSFGARFFLSPRAVPRPLAWAIAERPFGAFCGRYHVGGKLKSPSQSQIYCSSLSTLYLAKNIRNSSHRFPFPTAYKNRLPFKNIFPSATAGDAWHGSPRSLTASTLNSTPAWMT